MGSKSGSTEVMQDKDGSNEECTTTSSDKHSEANLIAENLADESSFTILEDLLAIATLAVIAPLSPITPTDRSTTIEEEKDVSTPTTSSQTGKKRRGGPGGLNKLCGVSPELQAIVGQPALPRTEIVKQLWAYIRKNNLQDPSNKRKIICNDELRLVFETDCTDMFKMNTLLAKHIIPLEPTKQTGQNSKRVKVDKESSSRSTESIPIVVISDALAHFFGTVEREMAQGEVLRRVWEYIKENQLEDPLNAMVIMCDAKLQELLGCESISALGIPEMLARHHLFKRS